MTDRFAYVIPHHEGNTDAETLAFWQRRDETFEAYLCDENGSFDGDFYATRAEAIDAVHAMATEMGWARDSYQLSIDE